MMAWAFALLFLITLFLWLRDRADRALARRCLTGLASHAREAPVKKDGALLSFRFEEKSRLHAPCHDLADQIQSLLQKNLDLQQLVTRQHTFESLLNEIQHGVVLVDQAEQVVFSNQAIHHFFPRNGFRPGRPFIEAVREDRLVKLMRKAAATGRRQTVDITLTPIAGPAPHGSGSQGQSQSQSRERSIHAEAAVVESQSRAVCLLLLDVTERVQLEQIRRDFVANASHEFRTPLAIIRGYVEMLLDGDAGDPQMAGHALRIIDKNGERLSRLVDDMLTISKLENAADLIRPEPFDLMESAAEVMEQLRPVITRQQAAVTLDFPAGGCVINGDRFYWDQILRNLVENALKENPRPGLKIRISAAREAEGRQWRIVVSDNGVGIANADLPFVFRRFYRGRRDHAQVVPGTGLGLSIVKRAVEAHGGTITLRSVPGVLTEFVIIL